MRQCLLLGLAIVASACSPPDREAQIRAFLDQAETAAESRDTGFFRSHIADEYHDSRGLGRDELVRTIRGYFFVNPQIEVISHVQRIDLDGDDFATAVVEAAIVGSRGGLDLDADFRTFELELARDGDDWELIGASWER